MAKQKVPVKHYQALYKLFPEVLSAVENLGSAIRQAGPIPVKTAHQRNCSLSQSLPVRKQAYLK